MFHQSEMNEEKKRKKNSVRNNINKTLWDGLTWVCVDLDM